ncbi:MAG: [protein-PII] uridylyltransferase [Alphaproteobacteria bacterium]|nr:[protein-PII] uridylyltransferase [Alphaproteobacteria bacterium]
MRLTINKPRDVIDRKAFTRKLRELARAGSKPDFTQPKMRALVLQLFKAEMEDGRAEIRRRFESREATGAKTLRAGAYLLDQVIRTLHEFTIEAVYPLRDQNMSLVATGGYGRAEIAPFSDLDLMFLIRREAGGNTNAAVEWMLYMLWDLGLKVGHATRTVDEAVKLAGEDVTILTSLLEARWISGDQTLYRSFQKAFRSGCLDGGGADFVKAKLDERDNRHDRMGDSRYVLEPNIKDGKGGLRDLQTLFWIAKFLYRAETVGELVTHGILDKDDARRFTKAQNFLWTVRCHLHYIAKRPDEIISFDVQNELARRMDYTDREGVSAVERFMKHYFLVARDVGDLTRVICAVLEHQHAKKPLLSFPLFSFSRRRRHGFTVEGGRLTVDGPEIFKTDPVNILRLFRDAERYDMDIHPEALRLVQRNLKRIDKKVQNDPEANAVFMEMLTSVKGTRLTLSRLNESGVFGRFMPDFARVVAQMQYDMYHVYTVDEHTILALDILSRIERGQLQGDHPVASKVIRDIQSRRVLYVAVLLHDIAKGRGGDHSVLGEQVARRLCPRLGLNDWETDTVAWLVLHHLDMALTAFKRDVTDPKTVRDFVELVQSPERLRLLLVLTVADIRAVGPNVWNGWKASLLRELYYSAQEVLTGGVPVQRREARADQVRGQLIARLADWSQHDVDWFLAQAHATYLLAHDVDTLAHHADIVRRTRRADTPIYIEVRAEENIDGTEVLVHTPDHPGLFAAIAGAMALSGASIVDAKIATLSHGMAMDTFWIQDVEGRAFSGTERIQRLKDRIERALTGQLRPERELAAERARQLPSRTRVFEVPPRVIVNNDASITATVIEVNGRNRVGFLHDVTRALTNFGLRILSAHISTYGEQVVDVFYVRDVFGLKVDQEAKVKALRKVLLKAIGTARGEPIVD